MTTILVLNPNTNRTTTDAMLTVVRDLVPSGIALKGATADTGPAMILTGVALAAAAPETVRIGLRDAPGADAIVVAAFGDPGLADLRAGLAIPVVGIGESSLREGAAGGRRFGIATTTPGLVAAIDAMVAMLGLGALYAGTRTGAEDPLALAADPSRQADALARSVERCLADGAEAVVIGGGPLARSASFLRARFGPLLIEPVPAAIRAALHALGDGTAKGT